VEEEKKEEPTFVAPKVKPVKEPEIATFTKPAVKPQPQPQKKSSIFDGMDFDSISSATTNDKKKAAYKYDRKKLQKKNRLAEDLEYTPIISPIFGNTQEEKKQFDKVHNAIQLNKPEEDSFTKIISPMFGNDLPTPKPVSSIPTKKVVVAENKSSITLDDMLEKAPAKKTEQDSLFEE
ncbi:MAG: hypothetical protein HUJ53_11340, partial [Holdemanella sp.]|nr:hypothetical protein [Holdemanella sp.]